ncbi:MAG: acyl carrier protein [Acidimicrobiales bacterium]
MPQVEDEIRRILAANAKLTIAASDLTDETDLFNVGMTSYATVSVMTAIEEHFGMMFPDDQIRRSTFQTISAMAAALRSLQP